MTGDLFDPLKLARVHAMLARTLIEHHRAPGDERARRWLDALVQRALDEVTDAVPDELQSELQRLFLPAPGAGESDDEVRIAEAQLLGWLNGLAMGEQIDTMREMVAATRDRVFQASLVAAGDEPPPSAAYR